MQRILPMSSLAPLLPSRAELDSRSSDQSDDLRRKIRNRIGHRLKNIILTTNSGNPFRQLLERSPKQALSSHGLRARSIPEHLTIPRRISVFSDEETILGPDEVSSPLSPPLPIRLVAYGAKPLALYCGESETLFRYAAWARQHGLTALLSPFECSHSENQGDEYYPPLWNYERPARGAGGIRGLLVGINENQAILGWLSILFRWTEFMGMQLGYPACCCKALVNRSEVLMRQGQFDSAIESLKRSGAGPFEWYCNIFGRYFERQLIFHSPCDLRCAETQAIALWYFNHLRKYEPELAGTLAEVLPSAIVHARDHGIFLFPDATEDNDGAIVYDSSSFLTTREDSSLAGAFTKRSILLQRRGSIGRRNSLPGTFPRFVRLPRLESMREEHAHCRVPSRIDIVGPRPFFERFD